MIDPIVQDEQSLMDKLAAIQTQKVTEQQDLVSGLIQKQASESDWMLALNRLSQSSTILSSSRGLRACETNWKCPSLMLKRCVRKSTFWPFHDLLEKRLFEIGAGLETILVHVRDSASDYQSRAASDDLNLLGQVNRYSDRTL